MRRETSAEFPLNRLCAISIRQPVRRIQIIRMQRALDHLGSAGNRSIRRLKTQNRSIDKMRHQRSCCTHHARLAAISMCTPIIGATNIIIAVITTVAATPANKTLAAIRCIATLLPAEVPDAGKGYSPDANRRSDKYRIIWKEKSRPRCVKQSTSSAWVSALQCRL